jgi:sn-glycerol 3-phosphate transport system substrate-binding protein
MTVMTVRRSPLIRAVAVLAVAGSIAAACGSGKSVTDAGLDPIELSEPAPVTTVVASGDAEQFNAESDADEQPENVQAEATTVPAPSTTVAALDDLPDCPVDGLADASDPVQVTLWFGLAGDLPGVLEGLAAEYNASQDAVVVDVQNQNDYESVIDKIVQFGVNDRPELLLVPEYVVQSFAQSELFIPVASCIAAASYPVDAFIPGALGAYAFSGTQWGMPFNASNPVLYYNRKMFEAAGLDPDDAPLSFDEIRSVSQRLVDSGAAAHGIVVDNARSSGTGGASFEQWYGRAGVPFADNGNGRLAPTSQVFLDDPQAVEILTFLAGMVDSGLAVSVGENAGGQAGLLKLADAQAPAAMVVETSAALTTVLAALGGGLVPGLSADDVGVAFMPGPSDVPAAQVGGGALWIPAGKSDAEAAAAWDFIQFLVEAQTQSTWANATGYIPVRTDAVELDPIASTYVSDPRFRVAYDQLLGVGDDALSARPVIGPQREIRQLIADAIARVYADPGGADIVAILADTDAAADGLIANYNRLN